MFKLRHSKIIIWLSLFRVFVGDDWIIDFLNGGFVNLTKCKKLDLMAFDLFVGVIVVAVGI